MARALLLAVLTWYIARAARSSFDHATRRTNADVNLRLLVGRLLYLGILLVGIVTILDIFGVPLSTLVTVLGVAGIGISLALQDILKNFFAGTYLLFERPFRIGDEISVKDHRGVVETIGFRTTTLRTADNVQILIPNQIVFTDVVSNRTYERPRESSASEAESERPAPAGLRTRYPRPNPLPGAEGVTYLAVASRAVRRAVDLPTSLWARLQAALPSVPIQGIVPRRLFGRRR